MPRARFGVFIPPRKKRSWRKHPVTLEFVLTGAVPSKKNRQRAAIMTSWFFNQVKKWVAGRSSIPSTDLLNQQKELLKQLKPFIRPSGGFPAWADHTKAKLIEQAAIWRITYPDLIFPITRCSIKIYHYWKDDRVRDNSNKADTLHDIFKEAGIISDDRWQVLHETHSEADLYEGEILDHITTINITTDCY
jgi:hypothetical protein